jgi:hypothetical protein
MPIIQSGKLTIAPNTSIYMQNDSRMIVKSGGELEVDGGQILNTAIEALPQSKLSLKNNAYIKLRKKGKFNIFNGAILNYHHGRIDITP